MLRQVAGIGAVILALASGVAPRTGFAAHEPANALAHSASPYLRLHAGDPVHWREWSTDLVAQAGAGDRLIFVSVGYFACHWCHVMQRESFSDSGAAALLNAHFVSVKVDRELDPALDAQLLRFVQATLGHAGWPLNVVLTPDGVPLFGFTYLPVGDFTRLLEQIVSRWAADRDSLAVGGAYRLRHARGRRAPAGGGSDGRRRGARARRRVHAAGVGDGRRARRRVRPGAEVPIRAAARAAAGLAAPRAGRGAGGVPAPHLRGDGVARAPRPARRRLLPLRDRPRLAGAALREDALRQRAARRALLRRRRRARRARVRADRDGHRRVHGARACRRRRRVLLQPVRRRRRRRGGRLLPVRRGRPRARAGRGGTPGGRRRMGVRRGLAHRARIPAGPGRGVERGGGARSRPVGRGHRGAARLGTEQAAGGARRAWAAARREAPGGMERARALGARACVDAPRRRSVRAADPCRRAPSHRGALGRLDAGAGPYRQARRQRGGGADRHAGDAAGLRLRRPWRDRVREGAR